MLDELRGQPPQHINAEKADQGFPRWRARFEFACGDSSPVGKALFD